MPTPRKPRQARSRNTYEAIIQGGFLCLMQQEPGDITTHHIAAAAGVGIGSLYEYFGNKEAVFAAMNQRFSEDLLAMLRGLEPRIASMEVTGVVRTILFSARDFMMQEDGRYLTYARISLLAASRAQLEPIIRCLSEVAMQYMFRHPELTRLPRVQIMIYIFANSGIALMHRYLSDPNPPFPFEEFADGIAAMVGHYIAQELQQLKQP